MNTHTHRPAVSVVMPTFNKARFLELTLASWCHQVFGNFEIVVADDGSTDDTRAVLASFADRLPLTVIHAENGGRAVARNRALARARGDLVVFCDDDRLVHPEFLGAHLAAHEASSGPLVVIGWQAGVIFELRPGAGDGLSAEAVARALQFAPQAAATLARGEVARLFGPGDVLRDPARLAVLEFPEPWFDGYILPVVQKYGDDISDCQLAWSYGNTGNLSTRRSLLEQIGGFDERFSGWGLEDADLHYRLLRLGARTRVARAARNCHLNHARNDTALKWNWLRNARHFLDKFEEMDIALYIQAELTNMPLAEADRILHEARAAGDSLLLRAYRKLLISHARELTGYGQMF